MSRVGPEEASLRALRSWSEKRRWTRENEAARRAPWRTRACRWRRWSGQTSVVGQASSSTTLTRAQVRGIESLELEESCTRESLCRSCRAERGKFIITVRVLRYDCFLVSSDIRVVSREQGREFARDVQTTIAKSCLRNDEEEIER